MAWVVTSRGTANLVSDSTANTVISAFTPGANKLLIAWISGFCDPSAVSGHGTWVQIGSAVSWNAGTLEVYACKTSGSPSSSTVTFTHAGDWTRTAGVIEIDEDVSGLPTAAADCFGTPATAFAAESGAYPAALTVSLGAFADADNLSFVIGSINNGANINWTPETNWTSIQDVGTTSVQTAVAYRGVEDTSPSIISADNGYVPYAVFGVEVKQAAGGGSIVPQAMASYRQQ